MLFDIVIDQMLIGVGTAVSVGMLSYIAYQVRWIVATQTLTCRIIFGDKDNPMAPGLIKDVGVLQGCALGNRKAILELYRQLKDNRTIKEDEFLETVMDKLKCQNGMS